jgi:hypothetical protein
MKLTKTTTGDDLFLLKHTDRAMPRRIEEAFGGVLLACHLNHSYQAWSNMFQGLIAG